MPKVSVIVPCYNVAPYLPRCLDSLIHQTLHDIEIICIDDKSTDDTLKILQRYAKQDKRITLIKHKKNTGVAIARNDGMEQATGKYIGFVDPDDYVDLDWYEKLYNAAKSGNKDIARGGVVQKDLTTGAIWNHNVHNVLEDIATFANTFWSAIYRSDFLRKNNITFPDNIITAQDCVFLTQVTLKNPSIIVIPETQYHYFSFRPDSLDSAVLSHAKALSRHDAFSLCLDYIEQAALPRKMRESFIRLHVLNHLQYNLAAKEFECDEDKQKLFQLLVKVYRHHGMKSVFKSLFGKDKAISIFKNKFAIWSTLHKKRIYLFGIIPTILVYMYDGRTIIYLFDIIPLLKIKNHKWWCLFGFIPVLKIKGI